MRRKNAVTVPEEYVAEAERAVHEGRSRSVSAYVSEALAQRSGRESLDDILDDWDRELGPPGPEAEAWAKRAWQRALSIRARSSPSTAATNGSGDSSEAASARSSSPQRSSPRRGATVGSRRGSRGSSPQRARPSRSSTKPQRKRSASRSQGAGPRTSLTRVLSSRRGATKRSS